MLGRGRHRSTSKHRLEKRQEDHQRRTVDVVDLRTGLTHVLPDTDAGGLIALCGRPVLPAALVDPGAGYCWDCRSTIPAGQRDVR
jgi:hypothetical protein